MRDNGVNNSGLLKVMDLFFLLICFLVVHRVYFEDLDVIPVRLLVLLFAIVSTYTIYSTGGLYTEYGGKRLSEELIHLSLAWGLVVLAVGLFAFLSKIAIDVSRLWFGVSMLASHIVMMSYRIALRFYLSRLRKQGVHRCQIVVVGCDSLTKFTLNRVHMQSWLGYHVAAVFDDGADNISEDGQLYGAPYAGSVADLVQFVEQKRRSRDPIDEVWLALPMSDQERILSIMKELEDSSVDVCIVPDLLASHLLNGMQFRVTDLSIVNVSDVRLENFGEWFKTVFDYIFAFFAVLFLAPIMLIIALLIRWDSPGPVIFKQRRYGVDGQEIEVWKFRSMSVTENAGPIKQATRQDARITKIGGFLRKTSLDELPQFFNVLQGRMSVVGPRPHAVSHNEEYRKKISGYMMRHKIKPGITGLAQINGWRGETDTLDKMEKRVYYDLEYIKNWSAWLDIKIVLLTLINGFTGKNAF